MEQNKKEENLKRYTVHVPEIWYRTCEVLATDEDAAKELVIAGNGETDWDDLEYHGMVRDPKLWEVEEGEF